MKRFGSTLFLLLFCLPLLVASDEFDIKLKDAEAVKTSDKSRFSQILSEIRPRINELSTAQNNYFLYLTGYEFSYRGKLSKAISAYQSVFANSQNESMKYRSALSLINIYAVMKEWSSGFRYVDYILDTKNRISNKEIRHLGMVAVTIFYVELEQYTYSLNVINQLKNDNLFGRNKCLIHGLELKALLNSSPEQLKAAQFNSAIELCLKENESVIADIIRTNLAQYHVNASEYRKAIDVLSKHLTQIHESKYELLIIDTDSILAKAYLGNSELDLAMYHAERVIAKDQKIKYITPSVDSYYVLYQIALKRKNFKSAAENMQNYIDVEKIQFEQTKAKQLAVESAKHQAAERDNEISLLNQQNQILQLEQNLAKEEATANRWIISLLILSVSLMILWLFYIKRSQQRLKYLAEYDGLTRVCNRTHFTESASTILKSLSKSSSMVSFIMFDLDDFKKVNDSFGHVTGDKVLQLAAHACSGCVRKADIFGRIGGEEFAIILPGCDIEQAMKIAEDCRQKLNKIDISESGCKIDVSASFGVTETKSSGYELRDLLAHADDAMYQAKQAGRNQVIFWKDAAA